MENNVMIVPESYVNFDILKNSIARENQEKRKLNLWI